MAEEAICDEGAEVLPQHEQELSVESDVPQ